MAYENLELIVVFNGAKSAFRPADYAGKLVLVTGGYDNNTFTAKDPYLYAIDDAGNYRVFDVPSSWVSGIKALKSGSTTEYVTLQGVAEFLGANGISVSIDNSTKKLTIDGLGLLGTSSDQSTANTIYGAKALANKVNADLLGTGSDTSDKETIRGTRKLVADTKTELIGNSTTDTKDSNTIAGAKKYTDAAITEMLAGETISGLSDKIDDLEENKADLENGKIPTSQLPDYILGQLLFGGTISSGNATSMTITPSANYRNKHTVPTTQTTTSVSKDSVAAHEGEYFIATIATSVLGISVDIGDWVVSTGTEWKKIDNTDSITKVAGVTPTNGDVPKAGLITALGIDKKYEKPSTGIPKDDLAQAVKTSLGKADGSVQSVAIATNSAAYASATEDAASGAVTINVKTTDMENVPADEALKVDSGLAKASDVYNYIKAIMSVKILS